MNALTLPSYKDQSPKVADRFKRIKQRDVILEADNITKVFNSEIGDITALESVSFRPTGGNFSR